MQEEIYKLYEKGSYRQVVQLIDANQFSAARDPMLANILAASYFKLGEYTVSLSLLKEIESCFSADAGYLSLFGACLRRCGDLTNSRLRLEQALGIQPDNPAIKNNFANLLIDLNDYEKAESILAQLLVDDPSYDDARANLKRLEERRRIQGLKASDNIPEHSSSVSFADPLLLAFGEDEVQRTRPKSSKSDQSHADLRAKLPPLKDQQIAADQLRLALEAVQEGRHAFALQLCSKVHRSMPTSAALFECVSDAYIALQRFAESEICLLHALQLGAKSFKLYSNLTSLLCIRRDFALAQHYLEQASLLDHENPLLVKLRIQIANAQNSSNSPMVRFDQEWPRPTLTLQET